MRLTERVDTKPVVVLKVKKERNILLVVPLPALVKSEVRAKAGAKSKEGKEGLKIMKLFELKQIIREEVIAIYSEQFAKEIL